MCYARFVKTIRKSYVLRKTVVMKLFSCSKAEKLTGNRNTNKKRTLSLRVGALQEMKRSWTDMNCRGPILLQLTVTTLYIVTIYAMSVYSCALHSSIFLVNTKECKWKLLQYRLWRMIGIENVGRVSCIKKGNLTQFA